MKKAAIIFLFLLFPCRALALGVGVVPDRIVFDEGEERFTIVNPNNRNIEYNVKSEYISCKPSEGHVSPHSKTQVLCEALEGARSGVILVETKGQNGSVGVFPAVAIKAGLYGVETPDELHFPAPSGPFRVPENFFARVL